MAIAVADLHPKSIGGYSGSQNPKRAAIGGVKHRGIAGVTQITSITAVTSDEYFVSSTTSWYVHKLPVMAPRRPPTV